VLGVTEDFSFFPFNLDLFNEQALIYRYEPVGRYVFARIGKGTTPDEMERIGDIFRKHNPGYEFRYDFVSDYEYEALSAGEGLRFMFRLFSGVAIFIAAMGLFGLSLYNNSRRTKEVGIRKAMGAHSGIIMQLLLSDFMKLVALSNVLGISASFFLIRELLQIFSYRVDLKPSVFGAVFLLSLIFSFLTVAYLAYRTARSNPVNSLRYE
jgi:putative ABC transport system permease protein